MDNPSGWFVSQLSSCAQGVAWAAAQVPVERQYKRPPKALGEWPAARHVFHLAFYEETIALPSMRQWRGGPIPVLQDDDEDKAWTGSEHINDLLNRFQSIRVRQIAMLADFSEADWNTVCETVWGPVTLLWVVTKTYQHTAEHISDMLRIALFWDHAAAWEEQQSHENA